MTLCCQQKCWSPCTPLPSPPHPTQYFILLQKEEDYSGVSKTHFAALKSERKRFCLSPHFSACQAQSISVTKYPFGPTCALILWRPNELPKQANLIVTHICGKCMQAIRVRLLLTLGDIMYWTKRGERGYCALFPLQKHTQLLCILKRPQSILNTSVTGMRQGLKE